MGNKPVIEKIVDDVVFCLKNIAVDALASVITREVDARKKQKALVIDATVAPTPFKNKSRKAIKHNANKNN
jgi:hypothetical protein